MRDMGIDPFERRRTILRVIFFVIILATIPFYMGGFAIWATAPEGEDETPQSPILTNTPIGLYTNTPMSLPTDDITRPPTRTPIGQLGPTPINPIILPTAFIPSATATNVLIPTSTTAPTLTTVPTQTPIPTATHTLAPTNTPVPSETPLPPASDTPSPTPSETVEGGEGT